MKIEIDTSKDSQEHIKKVINLLQSIVGSSGEVKTNAGFFDSPSEPSGGSMFGAMFGDDSEPKPHDPNPPEPGPQPEKPPEGIDLTNLQALNAPKEDDDSGEGDDLETY